MYFSDNAESLQLYNLLSSMLHDLLFLGYQSHFASYPYSFASYSYSYKILQPYVTATVRIHYDAVLSSAGATLMKTAIKVIVNNKW